MPQICNFLKKSWFSHIQILNLIVELFVMSPATYRELPGEGLYKLLESSTRDLLVAYDTQQENIIAINALKKQVELILYVLEEKRTQSLLPGINKSCQDYVRASG